MLRNNFSTSIELVSQGFLVAVEAEKGVSLDLLQTRLTDACKWVEGVGDTEVTYMGELESDTEADGEI